MRRLDDMQDLFLVIAAIGFGLGFLSAIISVRERNSVRRGFWAAVGAPSFIIGAGSFIVWLLAMPRIPNGMVFVAAGLLALGLILWAVILLTGRGAREGLKIVRDHAQFARKVALPGWRSLDTSTLEGEDRDEVSRVTQIVNAGAALVVLPGVVLVLAATILMNVRGSETSDFLAHAVGFYTLLIASCWTTSYILTILVIAMLQIWRGGGSGLALVKVANSVGTWAGLGAAAAVFVGALIPLVVVPLSRGEFHLLGMSLLDSISPSLLLDISTAGAVYGFLLGEVISLVSVSTKEKNIWIKATFPPLLFATVTSVLGLFGLSPGRLARALSAEYKKTVLKGVNPGKDPFDTALSEGLDSQAGWANVVSGLDQHGWNTIVDHRVFFVMTWTVAILVALFSTVIFIRRRETALLAMYAAPKSTVKSPASEKGGTSESTEVERPRPDSDATRSNHEGSPPGQPPPGSPRR